jgi:hypothetical protein
VRHGAFVAGELAVPTRAQLQVGHVLLSKAAPHAPLRGDRHRLVPPAANEVEERGGELEGPDRRALAQERRYQRRLELGGRLLLVLALVARPALPSEKPVRGGDDRQARKEGGGQENQDRQRQVIEGVSDLLLVALVRSGILALLRDDAIERLLVANLRPCGRGEHGAREEDAKLDELVRRHAHGTQLGLLSGAGHVSTNGNRVALGAVRGPGRRRREE